MVPVHAVLVVDGVARIRRLQALVAEGAAAPALGHEVVPAGFGERDLVVGAHGGGEAAVQAALSVGARSCAASALRVASSS